MHCVCLKLEHWVWKPFLWHFIALLFHTGTVDRIDTRLVKNHFVWRLLPLCISRQYYWKTCYLIFHMFKSISKFTGLKWRMRNKWENLNRVSEVLGLARMHGKAELSCNVNAAIRKRKRAFCFPQYHSGNKYFVSSVDCKLCIVAIDGITKKYEYVLWRTFFTTEKKQTHSNCL